MNPKVRTFLTWTVYPGVLAFSVALYYWLHSRGWSYAMSSYIAAVIGGLGLITFFEQLIPYREAWKPEREEIKTDLVFMILIQLLLPKLLSVLAAVGLLSFLRSRGWEIGGVWPHTWPAWLQMLLMILVSDFLRYWLHRAQHTYEPLWRFHAVHHSVQKLYWLNVGRFHPIDKAMQFFCDALPFIVVGVSEEVLTLYFVVYAIKGFFQHSDVDVKLGWLNYIISGPELHRWHHSVEIRESNNNYGNNVIVWDILFGSFFLPNDREVGELGLINRNYPHDFLGQMKSPFIKGIDKSP